MNVVLLVAFCWVSATRFGHSLEDPPSVSSDKVCNDQKVDECRKIIDDSAQICAKWKAFFSCVNRVYEFCDDKKVLAIHSLAASVKDKCPNVMSTGRFEYEISMFFDELIYTDVYDSVTTVSDTHTKRRADAITFLQRKAFYLVKAMDDILGSVRMSAIDLHLVLVDVMVGETSVSQFTDGKIDKNALAAYSDWIRGEYLINYHFDHLQIHTKRPLESLFGLTLGQKQFSACTTESVSAISHVGDFFQLTQNSLHEIGHSLGLEHPTRTGSEQYVMAPYTYSARQFSNCSIDALKHTTAELIDRNYCLLIRERKNELAPENVQPFIGMEVDITVQCRMAYGPGYAPCPSGAVTTSCFLKCCKLGKRPYGMPKFQGTSCFSDKSKICYWGKCVIRENIVKNKPHCADGDVKADCTQTA